MTQKSVVKQVFFFVTVTQDQLEDTDIVLTVDLQTGNGNKISFTFYLRFISTIIGKK